MKIIFLLASTLFFASCASNSENIPSKGNDMARYKITQINDQVWMAENLDYNVSGSKCYNDDEANCAKYGRFYDWATALTVCPSSWHLPSDDEWDALTNAVGFMSGRNLKAASGWPSCGPSDSDSSYICDDTHGFFALPRGDASNWNSWWTSDDSEEDSTKAYSRFIFYNDDIVQSVLAYKDLFFSVRCVKD